MKWTLAVIAVSAALVAVSVAGFIVYLGDRPPIPIGEVVEETSEDVRNTIAERLQAEAQLVSARQAVSTTITVDRSRALQVGWFQVPLPGQSLTYDIHGTALVGYDLSNLQAESLDIANNRLLIRLGQPQVIAVELSPSQSTTSDRPVPPRMVNEALKLAQAEIRLSLCSTNVFPLAEEESAKAIAQLLELGNHQVVVESDRPICPN